MLQTTGNDWETVKEVNFWLCNGHLEESFQSMYFEKGTLPSISVVFYHSVVKYVGFLALQKCT